MPSTITTVTVNGYQLVIMRAKASDAANGGLIVVDYFTGIVWSIFFDILLERFIYLLLFLFQVSDVPMRLISSSSAGRVLLDGRRPD